MRTLIWAVHFLKIETLISQINWFSKYLCRRSIIFVCLLLLIMEGESCRPCEWVLPPAKYCLNLFLSTRSSFLWEVFWSTQPQLKCFESVYGKSTDLEYCPGKVSWHILLAVMEFVHYYYGTPPCQTLCHLIVKKFSVRLEQWPLHLSEIIFHKKLTQNP